MNQEFGETRTQPDGRVRTFSMLLSCTPCGGRLARLLTVNALRNRGLPDERASHVVAELAANTATHGRVDICLTPPEPDSTCSGAVGD